MCPTHMCTLFRDPRSLTKHRPWSSTSVTVHKPKMIQHIGYRLCTVHINTSGSSLLLIRIHSQMMACLEEMLWPCRSTAARRYTMFGHYRLKHEVETVSTCRERDGNCVAMHAEKRARHGSCV